MEGQPQEHALTSPHPHAPTNKNYTLDEVTLEYQTGGTVSRLTKAASLLHGFIAQYVLPVKHTTPKRNQQADDVS